MSVCIQCTSFMRILCLFFYVSGEFQAPPIGLEYELLRVESFTMDLFGCKYSWMMEDGGEKSLFWYMWTWPKARSHPSTPADQLLSVNDRKPPDLLLHGVVLQLHSTGQEGPAAGDEGSGACHHDDTAPSLRHLHWLTQKEGQLYC